ncbi:hypothetical protein [Paenibacillus sp. SYP-B4298]|uniref:hypothetical protein n=1 Tax=Paenibacillus sp. SYP-B4298 TaxID=2996034 RepID=UPI0022DDBC55|nr:hypothetical protein [Paenibacillus sp. SYP-B4298]
MGRFKIGMLTASSLMMGIAILWFLLGTTANFQRGIDLLTTIKFIVIWLPAIIFLILPLFVRKRPNRVAFSFFIWPLIGIHFFLAIQLFNSVEIEGWLKDSVSSEPIQTTTDGLYNYRLELINMYQKNSSARVLIQDMRTKQDIYIPIEVEGEEVQRNWQEKGEGWSWSSLSALTDNNLLELIVWRRAPLSPLKFHLDTKEKQAKLITQVFVQEKPISYDNVGLNNRCLAEV